jgi:hypothetical protein
MARPRARPRPHHTPGQSPGQSPGQKQCQGHQYQYGQGSQAMLHIDKGANNVARGWERGHIGGHDQEWLPSCYGQADTYQEGHW